ncbi:MAG: hypothetical protein VB131_09825 [Burkholderia gladioli]
MKKQTSKPEEQTDDRRNHPCFDACVHFVQIGAQTLPIRLRYQGRKDRFYGSHALFEFHGAIIAARIAPVKGPPTLLRANISARMLLEIFEYVRFGRHVHGLRLTNFPELTENDIYFFAASFFIARPQKGSEVLYTRIHYTQQ